MGLKLGIYSDSTDRGSFSTDVAPHGVTLVKVSPGNPVDRKERFVKK